MLLTRKRIILLAAWLISLVAANYIGGVIGFSQGYNTRTALSGGDALRTTSVLRQLRDGNTDEVITFLESQLDGEIAAHVFGENAYDSPYNLNLRLVFGDTQVASNSRSFSEVLKYRNSP
jgi:hypothetical protein